MARFFSADPVVAAPLDGQAYNRYSYVHNRPLTRVDPTGYVVEEFSPPEEPEGAELSESGEYRVIVVRRPGAGYDELEQWADTLSAMGYNGYGQGGPGISPHSTNPNARRATFSSLPDKYAVIVTPEMCAKFEGCSGKGKPTPIRIWDAPIDEWAETAVDEATDLVPIVSHAKTVVNAVERIKNGEDVGEVLSEAAVDGVLSLAPGGKVAKKLGKKLGKALDKVGDAADAAGDVKRAAKIGPKAIPSRAGPTAHIHPSEVAGKTPAQIDLTCVRDSLV